jgi:hypothetical protein
MTVALLLSLSLLASAAPADLAPDTPTAVAPQDQMPVRLIDGQLRMDPIYVGLDDPIAPAYCIADCNPHTDVDCTGSSCTAVDRNCSVGQRGYVQCDGQAKIWCPTCSGIPCGQCTDGDFRSIKVGGCCSQGGQDREIQQCQNGCWVTTGTMSCAPSPQCPWIP